MVTWREPSVASQVAGRGVSLRRMNHEPPMSAQTDSWPRPHRLTVHDYYRMAEVGVLQPDDRTELIEGEIVDMPPIGDRKHPHPRDVLLLVEVSDSTLRYDLGKRASLYAAHGIPEYWVFDLQHDRVWRHRAPGSREYTQRDEIIEGTLPLPALDAELNLADLF